MGRFLDLALLIFSLQTPLALAQGTPMGSAGDYDTVENPATTPKLLVTASASFPNAEIFGIKLVNGQTTDAVLSFHNQEVEPVIVQFVGGSLWTTDPKNPQIVRNLTTSQVAAEIPPGEKQTIPYSLQFNLHPQDLRLNLAAVVSSQNNFFNVPIFNSTVSIVDPDTSIFDPQIIFLYLVLLASAVGIGYLFYNIWVVPYFPQKKKVGKKIPVKKIDAGSEKPDTDGPAVATGAKAYNEEWIPSHHMQRPEARRVKSGGPRPKSRGKPE